MIKLSKNLKKLVLISVIKESKMISKNPHSLKKIQRLALQQVEHILSFCLRKCSGCRRISIVNVKKSNMMPKRVFECAVKNLLKRRLKKRNK